MSGMCQAYIEGYRLQCRLPLPHLLRLSNRQRGPSACLVRHVCRPVLSKHDQKREHARVVRVRLVMFKGAEARVFGNGVDAVVKGGRVCPMGRLCVCVLGARDTPVKTWRQ